MQGGVAEVEFKDLRVILERVPVKAVKLVVTADASGKFEDGLFNVNIDYEFGFLFGGQDSGRVRYERKMEDDFYAVNFEVMSNIKNNPNSLPTVELVHKSDYKTKASGRYFFDDHKGHIKESTWEIDYINKETLKGIFNDGKIYAFEAKFNKEELYVDLVVDFDGMKYNGFAHVDLDGSHGFVEVNFDLEPAGKFDLKVNAKKDMSEAGIKLFLNDQDILSTKMKVDVVDSYQTTYEVKYHGMFVGDGKVRVSYKTDHMLEFQYLPKIGITCDMKFLVKNYKKTVIFEATAQEDEKKTFEVKSEISRVSNNHTLGFDFKVNWFMQERGPLYIFFYNMNCLHCLNSFNYEYNLVMERERLHKFDFGITHLEEDGSSHKEVYITTRDKYYAFFSKGFLNELDQKINNSFLKVYDNIELEGEWIQWIPGNSFQVNSNCGWFQLFLVENIDGTKWKVDINGKELMKVGWEVKDKEFKLTFEMPMRQEFDFVDGRKYKVDAQIEWSSDQFLSNEAKMYLNESVTTFLGREDWTTQDIINVERYWTFSYNKDKRSNQFLPNEVKMCLNQSISIEIFGDHIDIEGYYTFLYNRDEREFNLRLNEKLKADPSNRFRFSPTDLEFELDFQPSPLKLNQYVLMEGEKYAIECDYAICYRPWEKLIKKALTALKPNFTELI